MMMRMIMMIDNDNNDVDIELEPRGEEGKETGTDHQEG